MEKTVEDYQMDIVNAQIAITRIQTACAHDKGYICMMYSYRVGAYNPSRICKECKSVLPGITVEEQAEVRKNWLNPITVTQND